MTTINITLDPGGIQPCRATPGSGAFDLHALIGGTLAPGHRTLVQTGVHIALPAGHDGWVLSRSGIARKHGVFVLNAPGLVDSDYRGDVGVLLHNADPEAWFHWEAGDRIAQLYLPTLPDAELQVVDELDTTSRGDHGFGSTGIKAVA